MFSTPIKIHKMTSGFLYQHYYEHIHCFAITDSSRETVDAVYEKIIELDHLYAENEWHLQYLFVIDGVKITPYMALTIQKAVALTPPTLTESVAVVADSFLAKVLDTLIMPMLNWDIESETRFFHTDAEAFQWFEERLKAIG